MGKILPEYLSNWTMEKVKRGRDCGHNTLFLWRVTKGKVTFWGNSLDIIPDIGRGNVLLFLSQTGSQAFRVWDNIFPYKDGRCVGRVLVVPQGCLHLRITDFTLGEASSWLPYSLQRSQASEFSLWSHFSLQREWKWCPMQLCNQLGSAVASYSLSWKMEER